MGKHKVKIVDIREETEHDVEFGTCEICMGTGDLTRFWITFEVNGDRVDKENGYWSWGDYLNYFSFSNAILFINKFNDKDIRVNDISDITYDWMNEMRYHI